MAFLARLGQSAGSAASSASSSIKSAGSKLFGAGSKPHPKPGTSAPLSVDRTTTGSQAATTYNQTAGKRQPSTASDPNPGSAGTTQNAPGASGTSKHTVTGKKENIDDLLGRTDKNAKPDRKKRLEESSNELNKNTAKIKDNQHELDVLSATAAKRPLDAAELQKKDKLETGSRILSEKNAEFKAEFDKLTPAVKKERGIVEKLGGTSTLVNVGLPVATTLPFLAPMVLGGGGGKQPAADGDAAGAAGGEAAAGDVSARAAAAGIPPFDPLTARPNY